MRLLCPCILLKGSVRRPTFRVLLPKTGRKSASRDSRLSQARDDLESQWPIIASYFQSTVGYFVVLWPVILSCLEVSKNRAPRDPSYRDSEKGPLTFGNTQLAFQEVLSNNLRGSSRGEISNSTPKLGPKTPHEIPYMGVVQKRRND